MTTGLSQLLASIKSDGEALTLDVPADWMQGRSVFGGLQVAVALQAIRRLVPEATLRTIQTTFIAPVAGVIRVRAQILRTGKNATHVEARIVDGDTTLALVVAVLGSPRRSAVSQTLMQRDIAIDPAQVIALPFGSRFEGVAQFIQHFAVRWLQGMPPFSGAPGHQQVLELSLDDDGHASEVHVPIFADFIPPIALSQLSTPTPGSTLTWMLELLVDSVDHLPLRDWRVEAEIVAARDGYTNQSVKLFGPDGKAVAIGTQSMLVFG